MAKKEKLSEDTENIKSSNTDSTNIIAVGLDVGTGNFCSTRSDTNESKILRNAFIKVNEDDVDMGTLSEVSYIKNSDGDIFIIGQDAFSFCNIFGKEVSRPMEKGLISSKEIDSIDVLTAMIKNLIGDTQDNNVYVNYSIPAESIDENRSVTYHKKVIERILTTIGFKCKAVNEGMAIIYSECAQENFTGIGISFGAGMANIAIAYKGMEAYKFSTARSGDWIDKETAESLSMISNRVCNIKEEYLNLETGFLHEKNKNRRRVLEALEYYYEALINYTIKKMIREFNENVDLDIDGIPIILSGGTSTVPGFLSKFKNVLNGYDFPFVITDIRMAKNPLTAVSTGLLVKAMSDI